MLPPCGVDLDEEEASPSSSDTPIKRRPEAITGRGRFRAKKLRQSTEHDQTQPLASIPEETQRTDTLARIARPSTPERDATASSDPATPSYHLFSAQEPANTTEVDMAARNNSNACHVLLPICCKGTRDCKQSCADAALHPHLQ